MSYPPAPSAGAGVVEHRQCLVSILIDSRTRLQFVRTVDLSRHAVVLAWRDLLGFGEVIQTVDPVGGVILHEEHDTGSVFCPREQEQMIGAEVEHLRQRTKTG